MIGTEFFKSFQITKRGLNTLCADFIDLQTQDIPNIKSIRESLIFNGKKQYEKVEKYLKYYMEEMERKQDSLFKCLEEKLV